MSKAQEESARASLAARLAQGAMRGDQESIDFLNQLGVPMVTPCGLVRKVASFLSLELTAQGFHIPPRNAMQDLLRENPIGTPLHHMIASAHIWINSAISYPGSVPSQKIVRMADYRVRAVAPDHILAGLDRGFIQRNIAGFQRAMRAVSEQEHSQTTQATSVRRLQDVVPKQAPSFAPIWVEARNGLTSACSRRRCASSEIAAISCAILDLKAFPTYQWRRG